MPVPERAPVLVAAVRGPDTGGPEAHTWIGLATGGKEGIRVLSRDFLRADSPARSFDGRRILFRGRRTLSESPAIWEMGIDGAGGRLVTRGNGDPGDPNYLADGRIVFVDLPGPRAPGDGERPLFSCRPDGSDPARLTFGPYRDRDPELLSDGRLRFFRYPLGGDAGISPIPMVIHPDGTGVAGLVPTTGSAATLPPPAPTLPDPEDRILEIAAVTPRPTPPDLTSVVEASRSTGTLLCLNVYESDLPEVAHLPPGSVRRVRVARNEPRGGDRTDRPAPVLAEAPVFPDGSFLIEVPADTPLTMVLFDREDRPLARHKHGVWVRPNENRGCIGCHENRETAPENRLPMALGSGPAPVPRPRGTR